MKRYKDRVFRTMLVDVKDQVAVVTLNRPEALNASNEEMSVERTCILEGITEDTEVRAMILTGGEKVFSAGGDIEALSHLGSEGAKAFSERVVYNQKLLAQMPKPTIAAIAGPAYGGGMEQVLLCDLRIAAENARFALPEINVGIMPGGGGTQRLPRNIPLCRAKEMVFLGEAIDAGTALEWGLVNRVVPLEKLMEEAWEIALKLVKKPPFALKTAKMCLDMAGSCTIQTGLELESSAWSMLFSGDEQKNGMQAFLDKKKRRAHGGEEKGI